MAWRSWCASGAEHYDYIIIDGAPILPVTDSALLSRYADFTLVVARHNVTDRRSLERTCQILRSQGVRQIGMVLNGVKASRRGSVTDITATSSFLTPGATCMRRHKSIAAFLLLGALAVPCLAQQESLLIGPGDLIQVDVMDTPEMEQQVRVTDDGTVPLAYIGSIHVAGQTPATAAAMIQGALIEKNVMHQPAGDGQDDGVGDAGCVGTGPGAHARYLLHHHSADDSEGSVSGGWPDARRLIAT